MKKIVSMILAAVLILSLAGCGNSAKSNPFVKEFMAEFKASSLELEPEYTSDSELRLVGTDLDKYAEVIQLLKNIGFEYSDEEWTEEEAIYQMQLWQGTNGSYRVNVWLMLVLADSSRGHDYVKIDYYAE